MSDSKVTVVVKKENGETETFEGDGLLGVLWAEEVDANEEMVSVSDTIELRSMAYGYINLVNFKLTSSKLMDLLDDICSDLLMNNFVQSFDGDISQYYSDEG